jgi:hypothetical protein
MSPQYKNVLFLLVHSVCWESEVGTRPFSRSRAQSEKTREREEKTNVKKQKRSRAFSSPCRITLETQFPGLKPLGRVLSKVYVKYKHHFSFTVS